MRWTAILALVVVATLAAGLLADPPVVIDIEEVREAPDVPGIDPDNRLQRFRGGKIDVPGVIEDGGKAVDGLKLTLSADPTTLKTEQLNLRRALADSPHFSVEPTELTITFENVSKKPIKLDLYAVTATGKLDLRASGPQPASVRRSVLMINFTLAAPRPEDYPTVEPGKSLELKFKPKFPGQLGRSAFTLLHEGLYRVQVAYTARGGPAPGPKNEAGGKLTEGVWTGQAVSNAVELTVGEPKPVFGEEVSGFKLGVALPKLRYEVGEAVNATAVLANVTEKKLQTIPLIMGGTFDLQVTGPDGKAIPYRGPMMDIEAAPVVVEAGKSIEGPATLKWFDLSKPGKYTVQAVRSEGGKRLESGRLTFDVVEKQPEATSRPAADAGQGIEGTVVQLFGNHMPMIVMPGQPVEPERGGRRPLAVPVHVFKGKVKAFVTPDPRHPQLVRIVQSDKEGRFKVALEPGEYTVAAQIGGRMYLNITTGEGWWYSLQVKPDQWTKFTIQETSNAAF